MILWGFIKKELLQMIRNKIMVAAILIMPLVQVILITLALNHEARNINLGLDCKPNDYMMRQIKDRAIASGWFNKVEAIGESPFRALQTGKFDAVIAAPEKGFTKSVGQLSPQIQLMTDATNVLKAQAIEAYIKSISGAVLRENKLSSPVIGPNVSFKTRILFNPETNSTFFIYDVESRLYFGYERERNRNDGDSYCRADQKLSYYFGKMHSLCRSRID